MARESGSLIWLALNLNGLEDLVKEMLRVSEIHCMLSLLDAWSQLFIICSHVCLLETNTEEDALEALLSQLVKSEVLAELLAVVDLDT